MSETRTLTDVHDRRFRLTPERWTHIRSHPEHDAGTLDRIEADSPFIITAYFTDAIKKGEELWSRPSAP